MGVLTCKLYNYIYLHQCIHLTKQVITLFLIHDTYYFKVISFASYLQTTRHTNIKKTIEVQALP